MSTEEMGAGALLELQSERKREQSKLQGEKFQLDGSKTNFTTSGVKPREGYPQRSFEISKMGLF